MNKSRKGTIILLAIICCLALFLQMLYLEKGLAHDDIWLLEVIIRPVKEVASMEDSPMQELPVHHVVMKVWVGLFGDDEISLRMPNIIFSLLCIPAVYFLGRTIFDKRTGIVAALILTVSVYFVEQGQTIRAYTLFLLFSALSMAFFWRYFKKGYTRDLLLFGLFTLINIYTHFFASLLLDIQILFYIFYKRWDKKFLFSVLAIIALSIPIILRMKSAFLDNQTSSGPNTCHPLAIFNMINYNMIQWLMVSAILAALVYGLYKSKKKEAIFSGMVCFLPMAVAVLLSCTLLFKPKHYIFILPIIVIVAARGITRMEKKAGILALSIIIILSLASLADYYPTYAASDWKKAFSHVQENMQEDDTVFVTDYAYRPANYYLDGAVLKIKDFDDFNSLERFWVVYHDESNLHQSGMTYIKSIIGSISEDFRVSERKVFIGGESLHDVRFTDVSVELYEKK